MLVPSSVGCGKSEASAPRLAPAGDGGVGAESNAGGEGPSDGGASGTRPEAGGSAGPSVPAGAGESSGGQGGAAVDAAPTVLLRSISISQTLELPLMKGGAAVGVDERPAPLIAGKRALVRVFVDFEDGSAPRPLVGVLDVKNGNKSTRTILSQRTLAKGSTQDDLASTFTFDVDGADLATSSAYRVRILEEDTTLLARFPGADYQPLEPSTLPAFELVVVPFISNGLGPKTTETEMSSLRSRLLALYPSSDVAVTLAEAVTLPYVVNGDGDGWDSALDHILEVRAQAKPADNVFYFGAMAPDTSYSKYCSSSCILGYSFVADEDDVESRGSIGITVFQDGSGVKDAWDTVAHELGHAMGREHAPCGIDDPKDTDPDYPYDNGGMGTTYGYDFDLVRLIKPKPARDVMSYCTPVWISDYTYSAIFERLDSIANQSFRALSFSPLQLFRVARIRRDGQSAWQGERRRRASSRRASVDLLDAANRRLGSVEAQVLRVDHGSGGQVFVPAEKLDQSGATSVDLRPLGGSILPL
jgi:hypothetical protein